VRYKDIKQIPRTSFENLLFTTHSGFAVEFEQTSPFLITPDQVYESLGYNECRLNMIVGMESLLMRLSIHGLKDAIILVGGSFTSDDPSPKDIDLVVAYANSREVELNFRDNVFDDITLKSQESIFQFYKCNMFFINAIDGFGILQFSKWVTRFSFDKKSGTMRGLICFIMADFVNYKKK
jgi:hypothetical protein